MRLPGDATLVDVDSDVKTSAGGVRGRWERGVAVYRGLPFAAPPMGPLRFAAPRPAVPWEGGAT